MGASEPGFDRPQPQDLDKCVHCGLCLNACPTYRELGVEMDSPRGRIYQMVQVSTGQAQIDDSYVEHLDLCLACRACETACPSGVPYGRLIEAARAEIASVRPRPWLMRMAFRHLLPSRFRLQVVGWLLWVYQNCGLQTMARKLGLIPASLRAAEALQPDMQRPFFFSSYGKVFPPEGERRYRVAFLGGCIANLAFARLNEATVYVLQKNGCEVHVPASQTCCGALHVHAGLRDEGRELARKNIDALVDGGFDAILCNAGGCGSTLKEYDELLEHDPQYSSRAARFKKLMKDVNEFLNSIELNRNLGPVPWRVTYQDSCHLAHGQKVRVAPRKLLQSIPDLELVEMQNSDLCCGSAGIYNILHTDLASQLLSKKMESIKATDTKVIVSSNPGCMLQLRAGVTERNTKQEVKHVVELLAFSYQNYSSK
jgi:glycolate oxidase iron-sulfur subunit